MSIEIRDRYVSFRNIDCVGNAKELMHLLRQHIDDPEKSNPFWDKFREKLERVDAEEDPYEHDELFLIHTYVNNLYEIFEEQDDQAALELLARIERECC